MDFFFIEGGWYHSDLCHLWRYTGAGWQQYVSLKNESKKLINIELSIQIHSPPDRFSILSKF